jgi:predicted methyltransferase
MDMGKWILGAAAAAMLVSVGVALAPPAMAKPTAARAAPDFAAAVAVPGRPADQVKLDAVRHPAEVLAFEGLRRGDMALDLFAGGGYYTEIMARAVGPAGGVLAWDPANFANDKSRAAFAAIKQRAPNTGIFVTPANALSLPANAFDFVMIHLNYHDFYWESAKFGFPRVEPRAVLAAVYQAVKPGGIVAVIDHVGPAGDTRALVDKLHRIDPAVVKADFAAAGFVLEGQSDLLRNPADDHSKLVFDPSIRGNTDRFVYRFRKPR